MDQIVDRTQVERLGETLRSQEATLAVAESCTGGLLGAAITAVPGSSDFFHAGVTSYANDAKLRLLGVTRESLEEHGAVSDVVAREMARGVRDRTGTTWGVSITGVAGPGGGTTETPVGTVFVGVAYAGPWGTDTSVATAERFEFEGDRAAIRAQTVDASLEYLSERIETITVE